MNRFPHQDGPRGWHSRGYLPHFDGGWTAQFITFNLADAVPKRLLNQWKMELPRKRSKEEHAELFRKIERGLDRGFGECFLRRPDIAAIVEETLRLFHGKKYSLLHWVIMPNHVHLIIVPKSNVSLSSIMHSLKSFTAKEANRMLGRRGKFWNNDYFDRCIRNEAHFIRTVKYIEMNPVKARLCSSPEDWPFGSARFRTQETDEFELF